MPAQEARAISVQSHRVASSTPALRALPMVARPFLAAEERATPFPRQAAPRTLQARTLVEVLHAPAPVERMRSWARRVHPAAKALAPGRCAVSPSIQAPSG